MDMIALYNAFNSSICVLDLKFVYFALELH